MNRWKCLALAVGLSLSASALAGGLNMQPGLWQMTVKATMTGMPMTVPPQTHTVKHCLTKDQVENPWKTMQSHQGNCSFTNIHTTATGATYDMKCTGATEVTGHGEIVVESPTRMHDTVDTTMTVQGNTVKVHAEGHGKRIGDCSDSGE